MARRRSRRKDVDTDEEPVGSVSTMMEDRDLERDIDPLGERPGGGPRLNKIDGADSDGSMFWSFL